MRLIVVIVTYNSAATIGRCLESLAEAVKGLNANVIVVDNASTDQTIEQITNYELRITNFRLIRNERNVGFAKAVNQGVIESERVILRQISATGGSSRGGQDDKEDRFILLLNPDTEVEGDVIARTLQWMAAHPKVGVAGPVLLNSDGSFQPSVRRFPRFWTVVGMALKLHKVFPRAKVFREYFAEDVNERLKEALRLGSGDKSANGADCHAPRSRDRGARNDGVGIPVDQVMGAAFFINGKCWQELKGLDERFFLWFEEVDFCKRAKEALRQASATGGSFRGGLGDNKGHTGWEVVWLPFPAVRHIGGASFSQRPRMQNQLQFFSSARKYLLKHRNNPPFWFDRNVFWIAASLTVLFELLSFWGHEVPMVGAIGLAAIALIALVFGLRDPVWPVALIIAELAIGSKGYGLVLPLAGGAVSIRMALFAVAVAVGFFWMIKTRARALRSFVHKQRALAFSWLGLVVFILWGVVRGLALHNPIGTFFFDVSPWLFLLLLPSFLVGITSRDHAKTVVSALLGASVMFAAKTLFLLYVFTHDYSFFFLPTLYHWVRDTGNAEVTQLGENLWRIFAQSHLYTIIALFLLLALGPSGGALTFWAGALSVATILISLSRSFWFGIAAALLLLTLLPVARARLRLAGARASALRILFVGLSGAALLFAVARFPFPRAPGGLTMSVFVERVSNLSEEAAARSRWELLPALWHEVESAPLLGKGFGSTVRYRSADPRAIANSTQGVFEAYRFEWGYLDVWLKMGIGGLLALLLLLVVLGRRLLALIRKGDEGYQSFLFGLLSGLLIVSFTHITSPYLNHPLGIGYLLFATSVLSVI